MARTRTQLNYRWFAPLRRELAKGSLDPRRKDKSEKVEDPTKKPEIPTISQYWDPRDWLDHERHAIRAEARQEREPAEDDLPAHKKR